MKNILIIGSGLTGATLAYKHTMLGDKVTVVEKRNHIGGNVYTRDVEGITVHKYGAHIFHTNDKEVWDFVNQFVHFNNYKHQVKSRYKGQLYSLPINMNTFKEFFNIEDRNEITQGQIDYIKKCLYHGYSAKQWNRPVEDIDSKIFDRLPIRDTFNNNYIYDIYKGIQIEGYTYLISSLLQGSNIRLNFKINSSFNFTPYDIVYNTGPIDEFLNYELGALEYRSLKFIHEVHTNTTFQDYAVINEADIKVPYTRIIEHKHFNNLGQKNTIITIEYPKNFNGQNERYYTINDERNTILYERYKKIAKLKYPKMIFCGRLGDYKYYDMDDAIKRALEL